MALVRSLRRKDSSGDILDDLQDLDDLTSVIDEGESGHVAKMGLVLGILMLMDGDGRFSGHDRFDHGQGVSLRGCGRGLGVMGDLETETLLGFIGGYSGLAAGPFVDMKDVIVEVQDHDRFAGGFGQGSRQRAQQADSSSL